MEMALFTERHFFITFVVINNKIDIVKKILVLLAFTALLVLTSCDRKEKDSTVYTVLENAMATDYGDYYSATAENLYAEFWSGETDEDGNMLGAGVDVIIDFLCPLTDTPVISAGDYACNDSYKSFTFVPGQTCTLREKLEEELEVYKMLGLDYTMSDLMKVYGYTMSDLSSDVFSGEGSCITEFDEAANSIEHVVESGVVTVANFGDAYSVTMDLLSEGKVWKFRYEGQIEVEVDSDEDGGEEGGDVPSGDFTVSPVSCDACNYEDSIAEGVDDWYFELTDASGNGVIIDLFCERGKSAPVAGTYNVTSTCAKGTALEGCLDEDDYALGCWYFEGDECVYPADKGSVTISGSGTNTVVSFDFTCSEAETSFAGSYKGAINIMQPLSVTASVRKTNSHPVKKHKTYIKR